MLQVRVEDTWVPLDVSAKPPTPLSIFRAAVKAQIAHELAVRRQAELVSEACV